MRVRKGAARRRAKKRLLREAKGNVGGRRNLIRTVKETILRSRAFAYRDRKVRKRDFRALWITRITAACRARDISYSRFIHGLKLANVELNRKTLSELAIHEPEIFNELVELSREHITASTAA